MRLGQRRVRIRQSELERFIAAGESSSPEDHEIQGPAEPAEEHPAAEGRKRFRAAMAEASAAIDDDPHELAVALNALADAARALAGALRP